MERKILFTASTFSHIRSFHLPYLKYFHDLSWQVHVACGGTPEEIPWADRVTGLPLRKQIHAPENFRAAAMLCGQIRRESYALISTHTSLAAFFTRLAVKGMADRPPVINTVHGYLFDDETPPLKRSVLLAAERLTAPQTDLLLTMNRWDYELATERHLGKRVAIVPGMGVDPDRLGLVDPSAGGLLRKKLGISADAFVAICPAEFSERKSQQVLIRAMARLPEEAILILPGQGALRDGAEQLAVRMGLGHRVLFPGHVEDMGRWYDMADVSVSASRSEGLPFHVMEAMCRALPVVASRVKGHTDLIEHGETGLLYPYGDADACADTLLRLMREPELRRSMGAKGSASVGPYLLEQVLPVHVERYGMLLPELGELRTERAEMGPGSARRG